MDHGLHQVLRAIVTGWGAHFRGLAGLRLPFLFLALAVAAGSLAGRIPGARGGLWVALACALAIPSYFAARRHLHVAHLLLFGAVAAGVAARSVWTGDRSPAACLARAFPGPVVAEATGRVAGAPVPITADSSRFPAELSSLTVGDSRIRVRCPLLVEWTGPAPQVGDEIAAVGTLTAIQPPRNPGEFDRKSWMARQGIHSEFEVRHVADGRVMRVGRPSPQRLAAHAAEWIRATLTDGLDPDSSQARLIVGMTLGDVRGFDKADRGAFRVTGTLHLFSVSGLHVGMLGVLLWMILGGVPLRLRALVVISGLVFYTLITGWRPAGVRAAIMASFILAGLMAGHPSTLLNSLFAAAVFILVRNPSEFFNPGFQMSFVTVLALILLAGPLTRTFGIPFAVDPLLPRKLYTLPEILRSELRRRLAPSLAVVAAAWVGSLVLTGVYFHLLSVSSLPANILCVPLAFCVMAVSMMSLTAGLFSSGLAVIFNNANWLLTSALLGVVHAFAAIPGMTFPLPLPGSHQGDVVVFDMGSGAATAFDIRGRVALVDAGSVSNASSILGPWLDRRGSPRIASLILTHGDARHVGGAEEVLRHFQVSRVHDNFLADRSPVRQRVLQVAASEGVPIEKLHRGETIQLLSGVQAECLFPPRDHVAARADDKALILRVTLKGWRILLLSDAGPQTLRWLADHARQDLACDVVIQGAHRSGIVGPEAFWRLAAPQAVVATNARFPDSERLPPEARSLFQRLGIILLPMDRTGAVTLQVGDSSLRLVPFLREPTRTLPRRPPPPQGDANSGWSARPDSCNKGS